MAATTTANTTDNEPRVIKRYANRKMYDTQRSRYVTLDQIAEMVREGEDVRIVDNNSKEDLTSITLAQIIFEEEKKKKSFLPLQAMRNIIQSGGERIEELMSQAKKGVTGVFSRKSAPEGGPVSDEGAASSETEKEGARSLREFREWIQSSQQMIDEWQKKVDGRIRNVVEGISPFSSVHKEIAGLGNRIADLEKQLERLAKRGGK